VAIVVRVLLEKFISACVHAWIILMLDLWVLTLKTHKQSSQIWEDRFLQKSMHAKKEVGIWFLK